MWSKTHNCRMAAGFTIMIKMTIKENRNIITENVKIIRTPRKEQWYMPIERNNIVFFHIWKIDINIITFWLLNIMKRRTIYLNRGFNFHFHNVKPFPTQKHDSAPFERQTIMKDDHIYHLDDCICIITIPTVSYALQYLIIEPDHTAMMCTYLQITRKEIGQRNNEKFEFLA